MTAPHAPSLIAQEARKACEALAAGDLARYETHRANARRAREAMDAWEQTGDYWAGRLAAPEVRDMGGGRAYYRRCLVCGGHSLTGSESAHVRWCDAEQARVSELQAAEVQALRIRGLI